MIVVLVMFLLFADRLCLLFVLLKGKLCFLPSLDCRLSPTPLLFSKTTVLGRIPFFVRFSGVQRLFGRLRRSFFDRDRRDRLSCRADRSDAVGLALCLGVLWRSVRYFIENKTENNK